MGVEILWAVPPPYTSRGDPVSTNSLVPLGVSARPPGAAYPSPTASGAAGRSSLGNDAEERYVEEPPGQYLYRMKGSDSV